MGDLTAVVPDRRVEVALVRHIVMTFRVTTEEYLRIKKRALKEHRTTSQFIVRQCLGEAPCEPIPFAARSRTRKSCGSRRQYMVDTP